MDRPSVLVLTSTFPRWEGDTEPPFVFELCRRLAFSHEIHVVAPHAPGSRMRETIEGVHVHRYRYGFEFWEKLAYQGGILGNLHKNPLLAAMLPLFLAGQLFTATKLLRRVRVQVIHAHWILPQGLIAILAKMLSQSPARILCTVHGGDAYGLRGAVFDRVRRWAISKVDRLTVVSRSLRMDLARSGADARKISVVPMGVDLLRVFLPPERRTETSSLLFVGRLVKKKGARFLIEALPAILKQFSDTKLIVAGDGPERATLEEMVSTLRIQDHVTFTGAVPNSALPALYQQASVFVFPSVVSGDGDREGFGLALVEAMGCGCAAVVTDLPAMQDIVQSGETAIVVGQASPEEIAGAVMRLLGNPELRSTLACAGRRQSLSKFDWTAIIPQYRAIIDGICTPSWPNTNSRV